jgi:hypothetical protein
MADLERALAEITLIRNQMARSTEFRGLGAATLAATGALALLGAAAQALWIEDPIHDLGAYLSLWIGVAVVSAVLIGAEMATRTVRAHGRLAQEMLFAAVEQFLPAAVVGALLTVVLYRAAPTVLWMLPGLWQIVCGLGIFASRRSLPSAIGLAGAWYLASGLACLAVGDDARAFAPWMMGAPFAVGQALIAAVVYCHGGEDDGQA